MKVDKPDEIVTKIGNMNRHGLVQTLRTMQCPFSMDFTDEYLNKMSMEHLQHIVLAASLHISDAA